jgi:putative colanic acid biosynthesis acetyltransferase WcaF
VKTDLSKYDNSWYNPGAGFIKRTLWHFTNHLFFTNGLFPYPSLKVLLLKVFGATIGRHVNIKPGVNIKYPWYLRIGDYSWIGESVWIDNLGLIEIGANVCISQGAMLLTGNHNYSDQKFALLVGKITIEDGVWLGAQSVVCPGVVCYQHSVLSVKSVATQALDAFGIYQGNPAKKIRERKIS